MIRNDLSPTQVKVYLSFPLFILLCYLVALPVVASAFCAGPDIGVK